MPENSSRPNPLLEQRFEQLTQGFFAFCQSDSLLPEELHNPPVFFNALITMNLCRPCWKRWLKSARCRFIVALCWAI